MIEGWPELIAEAQQQPTWMIGGKEYGRVRFGEEEDDWGADAGPCRDCRVLKGEFHVSGCDAESCPACGDQVISCDCPYDDDEEEDAG